MLGALLIHWFIRFIHSWYFIASLELFSVLCDIFYQVSHSSHTMASLWLVRFMTGEQDNMLIDEGTCNTPCQCRNAVHQSFAPLLLCKSLWGIWITKSHQSPSPTYHFCAFFKFRDFFFLLSYRFFFCLRYCLAFVMSPQSELSFNLLQLGMRLQERTFVLHLVNCQ